MTIGSFCFAQDRFSFEIGKQLHAGIVYRERAVQEREGKRGGGGRYVERETEHNLLGLLMQMAKWWAA